MKRIDLEIHCQRRDGKKSDSDKDINSSRIHRAGTNVGTRESERKPPTDHSANLITIQDAGPYESSAYVVQSAQTYVFATYTMRCSGEMRWPLQRPVQLLLTNEVPTRKPC